MLNSGAPGQGILSIYGNGNVLNIPGATFTATRTQTPRDSTGQLMAGSTGAVTLLGGTATVSNSNITAAAAVTVSIEQAIGTIGAQYAVSYSTGTGFTITSITAGGITQNLDASKLRYIAIH
jgi:hypothetical protein